MLLKKPEFIFLIIAFVFGVIMMLITPPFQVPDENAHLMRACEVADGIFYNKTPAQNVECDKYIQKNIHFNRRVEMHQATGYSPVMYMVSALGLNTGKNFSGTTMFYLGRFFNLLMWILLITFAIRITPVFKYQFLFVALLPMSLYEGMSYSADSFNNGFTFLFFAYIFKLIFEEKQVTKKDIFLLSLMTFISALTKGTIYPVILFFFLPIKKHKVLFASLMLLVSFSLMSFWASINMTYVRADLDIELNKYILLHNPQHFLKAFLYSIQNTEYYLKGCIGILGWLNIRFRYIFYLMTGFVFLSMFLFLKEEKVTNKLRITSIIVFAAFVIFLHIYYFLIWTFPADYIISGIQGRYFIPILPYMFLILAQNKNYFQNISVNSYKIFLIIYILCMQIYTNLFLFNRF